MIGAPSHIIRYARCVATVAPRGIRLRMLAPFAALGIVEMVLLLLYTQFTAPGLSLLAAPIVAFFFGESSLHYPQHVWDLPAVLDWIRFLATVCPGFFLYMLAVRRLHADMDTSDSPVQSHGGAGSAFVAVLCYAALDVAIQRSVGLLAEVRIVGRFQPLWIIAAIFMRSFLAVALAHTLYGIVIAGRRGAAALRSGVIVVQANGVISVLIALTATALIAPLDLIIDRAAWFVDSGQPGVVETLAAVAVLWDVPVRLFLVGSSVWVRLTRGVVF